MQFKDIIGQDYIKKKLINTVKENRVSHAQLFLGPEGSGKLALAIAYAQYISCTDKKTDDSCGVCNSCIKYNKLIHPDIHFYFPTAGTKKNTKPESKVFIKEWREFILRNKGYIALEDWLEFIDIENKQATIYADDCNDIIKTVALKSFESDYKIYIIYMAEKIYHASAPKLLKLLEEPPDKTLFILITENHDQIINTILSRTQLVKINKLTDKDIAEQLQKNNNLDSYQAMNLTKIANGNYNEALRLIDNIEDANFNFQNFSTWMRACYKADYASIITWIDSISKVPGGREKFKRFFSYALKATRNCLIINNLKNQNTLKLPLEEAEFFVKFSPFINDRNMGKITDEFNKAYFHIERNVNQRVVLMDISFSLVKLLKL